MPGWLYWDDAIGKPRMIFRGHVEIESRGRLLQAACSQPVDLWHNGRENAGLLKDNRRSLEGPVWHQVIFRGLGVLAPDEVQRALKRGVCPTRDRGKGNPVLDRGHRGP